MSADEATRVTDDELDQVSIACLRILIADDHPEFTRSLARWLKVEVPGWTFDTVHDPAATLVAILQNKYDMVLLDWRFSGELDGPEICRKAREAGCTVPIIMLTLLDGVRDRLRALRAGADEHVVKDSLTHRELCRRIEVTFQRAKDRRTPVPPVSGSVVIAGPLTVHLGDQVVFVHGKLVHLPKNQRGLLMALARSLGEVVPHDALCAASGVPPGVGFKNLHNEMLRLRQALGAEGASRVRTVRLSGYRLN